MNVIRIPIADLHEDPANVRVHPERNLAAIKASLARFGQQKPIVIDGANVVRAGNGTLAAARALGWDSIDVVRTGLEGVEAVAYSIADNRTGELAEWDYEGLETLLEELRSEGDMDWEGLGFDDIGRADAPEEIDAAEAKVKLEPAKVESTPYAWVLICVPLTQYGRVDRHVREIAKVSGVRCETALSVSDGSKKD